MTRLCKSDFFLSFKIYKLHLVYVNDLHLLIVNCSISINTTGRKDLRSAFIIYGCVNPAMLNFPKKVTLPTKSHRTTSAKLNNQNYKGKPSKKVLRRFLVLRLRTKPLHIQQVKTAAFVKTIVIAEFLYSPPVPIYRPYAVRKYCEKTSRMSDASLSA